MNCSGIERVVGHLPDDSLSFSALLGSIHLMEEYAAVAAGELADSVVVVVVGNAFEWCHMRRRRWRRMPGCMAEGWHPPLTKCWLELLPAVAVDRS